MAPHECNLTFADDTWEMLEELSLAVNPPTKSEVILRGIVQMDWIHKHLKPGQMLTVSDENGPIAQYPAALFFIDTTIATPKELAKLVIESIESYQDAWLLKRLTRLDKLYDRIRNLFSCS